MGKLFRLFNGELKKIFLGPGIFFMTAFLILALTIAPKIFNPTSKEDITSSISIETTTVIDAYTSFLEYKTESNTKINNIKSDINSLIENQSDFKADLQKLTQEINDYKMQLDKLLLTSTDYSISNLANCIKEFILKNEEFSDLYKSYMSSFAFPLVLVDEQLDLDIKNEVSRISKTLNMTGDKTTRDLYEKINENLDVYKPTQNLNNLVNKIKSLNYSKDNLTKILTDYPGKKSDYKEQLFTDINQSANLAYLDEEYNISDSKILEIKKNAISYLSVEDSIYNIMYNKLLLEFSNNTSDSELATYIGFKDFNSYKYKELATKYEYLLDNKITDENLATLFSFNTSSSSNVNAFDYMYLTMEIASVLIIAFTVIIGAGMISKEYSEGTIKLLAIRPFNRNKIILAKILATMFMAFILVLVTSIISFITGYFLYGISFPTVLLVFNGSTAFTLPIFVVYLIYLACLLIKIWVFALLAIAISTIFKSYIAAVCVSTGIYIINLILTFISKGASWLKYNIFANLDLFKFFGGSNIANYATDENLTSLFISPVFPDTSVWLSIISIASLVLVLNIVIFTVFKHRDI